MPRVRLAKSLPLLVALAVLVVLTGCPREGPPEGQEDLTAPAPLEEPVIEPAPPPEEDMAAVREHTLTVDEVRRYAQAAEAIHEAITQDPDLREAERELQRRFETAESLADAERIFNDFPHLRQALEQAGISTEDYLLTGSALFGAYNYVLMREQGIPDPFRPDYVTDAHIQFIRDNRAQVDQVVARLMEAYSDELGQQ